MKAIGIDLGGTHLRLAIVSERGHVRLSRKVVVGSNRSPEKIVKLISNQLKLLKKESNIKGRCAVGMGVPGIVSSRKGVVYASPYYPQWRNFTFAGKLRRKISYPVVIDNDANMIALGEMWKGAARGWDNFIMMTLGTGIGGALVINGKIFHGNNGFTGEVGHMVIERNGPSCACGSRGCFETLASATAMARMAREMGVKGLSGKKSKLTLELASLAGKGNKKAKRIFKEFGTNLGIGIASLVNVTGIQKIVLGGGLIGARSLFLSAVKKELKKRTYSKTFSDIEIRCAQLGDDAGILGSALTAFEKASRTAR